MTKIIKIHTHKIPWDRIREYFVLFLFCVILAVAAFALGMIHENRRNEQKGSDLQTLQERVKDHEGRITAVEGPRRK